VYLLTVDFFFEGYLLTVVALRKNIGNHMCCVGLRPSWIPVRSMGELGPGPARSGT
jgi:hypothetical protein